MGLHYTLHNDVFAVKQSRTAFRYPVPWEESMLQVSKVREFISDMFQNFVQAGRAQHFATQVLITHTVTSFPTNVPGQQEP